MLEYQVLRVLDIVIAESFSAVGLRCIRKLVVCKKAVVEAEVAVVKLNRSPRSAIAMG